MNAASYPVFLNLWGQACVIVGGGRVALRKARGLLAAGAVVTVISPVFAAEFAELPIVRREKRYESGDLEHGDYRLAFAATDDRAVNERVAADAHARRIWCCRCDDADEAGGQFSGAAVATIGGICVAVSTSGGSAALAARLRDAVTAAIDPAWGRVAERMQQWRKTVLAEIGEPAARRALLLRAASDEMLTAERAGRAEETFEAWLRDARSRTAEGQT